MVGVSLDNALVHTVHYRLETHAAKLNDEAKLNNGPKHRTPAGRQSLVRERDARVLQYMDLRASRLSPSEIREAEKVWLKKRQDDWVRTHTLSLEPRVSLTKEKEAALKEAFDMMDLNGDGTIGYQELSALMKTLGQSSEQVQEALAAGDLDGSASLDFPEFCSMMMRSGDGRRAAREASDSFPFTLVVDSHRITHTIDSLFSKELGRFPDSELSDREQRYRVERRRRRGIPE